MAEGRGTSADSLAQSPEATHPRRRREIPFWLEVLLLAGTAFTLAFLLQAFAFKVFFIPSGSMEKTLQIGDRVFVNRLVYHFRDPARGDIVVFNGVDSFEPETTVVETGSSVGQFIHSVGENLGIVPSGERDFVKRVIGVGGDHVVCCDSRGRVTVNGVALDETSYIYPGDKPSDEPFDVTVPQGKLWVMGDHRSASADSRAHIGEPGGGFVPVDRVIGRAFVVIWPWSDKKVLQIPATFDQPALTKQPSVAPTPSSSRSP